MNYLPLLFILFYILKSKNENFLKNFNLSGIDLNSLSPILSLFGKEDLAEILSSNELSNFLQGKGDIKSLLPLLPKIIATFKNDNSSPFNFSNNSEKENFDNKETFTPTPERLNPIEDIASERILNSLNSYFSAI